MVQMRIEDEHNMYLRLKVPHVLETDVAEFAKSHPQVPIIALCCTLPEAVQFGKARNLYVDIAFAETEKQNELARR